jgi:hypothetical protein
MSRTISRSGRSAFRDSGHLRILLQAEPQRQTRMEQNLSQHRGHGGARHAQLLGQPSSPKIIMGSMTMLKTAPSIWVSMV